MRIYVNGISIRNPIYSIFFRRRLSRITGKYTRIGENFDRLIRKKNQSLFFAFEKTLHILHARIYGIGKNIKTRNRYEMIVMRIFHFFNGTENMLIVDFLRPPERPDFFSVSIINHFVSFATTLTIQISTTFNDTF